MAQTVKTSACNAGDPGSIPGSGRFPWRRKGQPTPVFLPGESHGQRSLVGYSPLGHKEWDTTERLHFHRKWKQWQTFYISERCRSASLISSLNSPVSARGNQMLAGESCTQEVVSLIEQTYKESNKCMQPLIWWRYSFYPYQERGVKSVHIEFTWNWEDYTFIVLLTALQLFPWPHNLLFCPNIPYNVTLSHYIDGVILIQQTNQEQLG